ncbi:response regulator [Candidatus Woesearchaeota archaeon]|nr:response regulator [Candidatus Woesearchaeota archaeon]
MKISVNEAKKLYRKKMRSRTLNELSAMMYEPESISEIFDRQKENIRVGSHKQKILVVDDEPHIVDLIKMSLSDQYTILGAYTGEEAVEMAIREQPDLITMDIMMPGLDGFEVTRRLKDIPATRNIPIIMLSAKDQLVDKFEGIDSGAIDYVTKPFEPSELIEKIQQNLI